MCARHTHHSTIVLYHRPVVSMGALWGEVTAAGTVQVYPWAVASGGFRISLWRGTWGRMVPRSHNAPP